ncbi:NAD(P)/FAD-dependent oxidoreductase [Pleionea litopenaei]|uniref:NAD(P)/FAD-dependent oxidoreductase n=1 Tax=Pleionea litopenaei TaxID=3070815 RepID=A0AA51RTK1_9GAMM|nr:NAD(P)/FAD-dependent oxidoreductase [Pleionea sp. HL-JVS1]WMS87376.1 NAD(P)/FAD-dependent oxidoreductase [Pleionea sp. HL-JVS1]
MKSFDVVIIGAGAAGLMCAISAGSRGKSVLVLEHARKVGRKILMSGGGRCNFTNMYTEPDNFLSQNPHFCKSALSQFTQWDFIAMVEKHGIPYHEKTLGQLFCDNSSKDIVDLLLSECQAVSVDIRTRAEVTAIEPLASGFQVNCGSQSFRGQSLVVATGGLSIPSMGPHGFGYKIAEQLGLSMVKTRAALVPFVMDKQWQSCFSELSGSSLDVVATAGHQSFREGMLFTHKGLSGPAILQISSYWRSGEKVTLDLLPNTDIAAELITARESSPNIYLRTWLARLVTKRMAEAFCRHWFEDLPLHQLSNKKIQEIATKINHLSIMPNSTEGYKTAEVTLGGVNTDHLSSKSMMVQDIPGLYFIGETVDVTGHLGGFNFQWAWASGWAAGQHLE